MEKPMPVPSMSPSQVSARNTEEGARFDSVLFAALDALTGAGLSFALIGGVAASGLGRPRSTHDIDIFVRPEDADATLNVLERHGFRTEKTDIEWLYKAFKDDILVDIVFRSRGDIYFDEEMQAHARLVEYHGRKVPLVSPEDLAIIKCAVHFEGGPHHWHDALAILSHAPIDWNYLLRRARKAPRRLLSLLLYAQSNDILIPNSVILHLFSYIFKDDVRLTEEAPYGRQQTPAQSRPVTPAPPPPTDRFPHPTNKYLVAHIRDALAEDPRTGQQDLKILVDGKRIVVRGETSSQAQVDAILDVIRGFCPDWEIVSQISVSPVEGPEHAEAIS